MQAGIWILRPVALTVIRSSPSKSPRSACLPGSNPACGLDSGTPGDNYEVTKDMYELLCRRGYTPGKELLYFSFPEALNNEKFWAQRSHLPFQYFFERS